MSQEGHVMPTMLQTYGLLCGTVSRTFGSSEPTRVVAVPTHGHAYRLYQIGQEMDAADIVRALHDKENPPTQVGYTEFCPRGSSSTHVALDSEGSQFEGTLRAYPCLATLSDVQDLVRPETVETALPAILEALFENQSPARDDASGPLFYLGIRVEAGAIEAAFVRAGFAYDASTHRWNTPTTV